MSSSCRTILFVHPSDELYGSDRCLLEIVRNLPETDRAIVVLPTDVSYSGALSQRLQDHGARVIRIDMLVLRRAALRPANASALLRRLLIGTWSLVRLVRSENVSVVHSNTVAVVCCALAATVTRTPHLWHVHEFLGDEPGLFRTILRAMLDWTPGAIVANSKAVARSIVAGNRRRARKTTVIYNGVSPEVAPQPTSSRPEDRPITIGVVGRIAPRKGIEQALQASAILHGRGHCHHLRFRGTPPPGQESRLAEYRRRARELGIVDCVTFAGYIDDINEALQDIDILLAPSQRPESFGLVLIEGMAAGLPVAATRNGGGSDEILDDGVTGLYCERDPESIADALERLLLDPALRSELGHNARAVAASRFSVSRYTAQIQHVYDRLAGPER